MTPLVHGSGRAGGPSDRPCADSRRPALRRPGASRPRRASHRRSHPRRAIRRAAGAQLVPIVEPWRASFQEIAEFLTGDQAEAADHRVLAMALFIDIGASMCGAAEMGDRDWHALLDAHDAVVRAHSSLSRP